MPLLSLTPRRLRRALVGLALVLSTAGCAVANAAPPVSGDNVAVQGVPERYQSWVVKAGTMCAGITGPIIAAQIETESSWNETVVSTDGYATVGLTQFRSGTWAAYGRDDDGNGQALRTDPGDAIMAQARYDCDLRGQMVQAIADGKVQGDATELALAGYNAGPERIISGGGMAGAPVQTRAYVPKILALAASKYTGAAQATMPTDGSIGSRIAAVAMQQLGKPYAWGGGGPQGATTGIRDGGYADQCGDYAKVGFDCSGLVQFAVYQASGGKLTVPRTAAEQARSAGVAVPARLDAMQVGDLVAFDNGERVSGADHIGIYVGNGQMVNAPQSCKLVSLASLVTGSYSDPSEWSVRRIG